MLPKLNRRDVVRSGLTLLGTSCLPTLGTKALGQGTAPHFFIYVNLFPGADTSYLFDARQLSLTAANKMQNFLGKDPLVWEGTNGEKTLTTEITDPLKPFRDKFSVVNGVQMATTFDGHEQNQGFIFTGSPFGGESLLPHLNKKARLPLDMVSLFQIFGVNITNGGASLTTDAFALAGLPGAFLNGAPKAGDPTAQLIKARLDALSQGEGNFSIGSRHMREGYVGSGSLAEKLKAMEFKTDVTFDPVTGQQVQSGVPINLQVVGQFLKQGVSRTLHIGINGNYDVHDNGSCRQQPETFRSTVAQIIELFKFMQDTAYDETQSLFDVTTFVIGSEFSRTMRQQFAPNIDQTGTDHNPLCNSFMIGGKGVKGGLVLGASDNTSVDANGELENVSGAHKKLDPNLLKIMAKPFDYQTFKPKDELPEDFNVEHYLSFNSVANTLYEIFGFSQSEVPYRRFTQGGIVVPSLKPLIG